LKIIHHTISGEHCSLKKQKLTPNNGMGCGATWVSLLGWGGRGKLGFPTLKEILINI